MQIRRKLTYQFIVIVALILFFSCIAIYYFSADYRTESFYSRLHSKATNTAKLLIEVEEVDVDLLKKIDQNNPVSLPNEKIVIFNYLNEVLYDSDEEKTLVIDSTLLNRIRLEGEIRYQQDEYEVIGFLFTDRYDRFVVVAGAIDIHGLKKLKNLLNVLLVVFGVGIIIVLIAGWIYAGRALRPISNVIDRVDEISITSLNLRVDEGNSQDEIAKLAHTFNKMLERLEGAFKMQKNFIANASHELRTPLTAITGQLEVVLMNERTSEEYKKTMLSVLDDMKNLGTTSNRLLLLAQASSETAEAAFNPLRIDDLIWQTRNELIKRNPEYSIKVTFHETLDDEEKLTVYGNEQLIKTVLINLMENGCKYSGNHEVTVSIRATAYSLVLGFSDKGIGIEPYDLEHIFEPFHRGKNAVAYKGHGIGLSLVERIVLLHKGEISVVSEFNKGTTFTLTFPFRKF